MVQDLRRDLKGEPAMTVFFGFRHGICAGGLAWLSLLLSSATATADPAPANAYDRSSEARPACASAADCDRQDYDESGTRGRMGLGASPLHPEGPGNAPN
jgi:hypothetical protein